MASEGVVTGAHEELTLLNRSDAASEEASLLAQQLFLAVSQGISRESVSAALVEGSERDGKSKDHSEMQGNKRRRQKSLSAEVRDILCLLSEQQNIMLTSHAEMRRRQDMEEQRMQLQEKIVAINGSVQDFAKRMRDVESLLTSLLDDYDEYRQHGQPDSSAASRSNMQSGGSEKAKQDQLIDVADLVSYARRISYTTFAPPEFAQGIQLVAPLPPAPQEEQFRASMLSQFSDEAQLGIIRERIAATETAAEAATATASDAAIATPVPTAMPPATSLEASPVAAFPTLPPNLPPPPPGWKPGDPLQLPEGFAIPAMPAGWKPGDSLPSLPLLPATLLPSLRAPPSAAAAADSVGVSKHLAHVGSVAAQSGERAERKGPQQEAAAMEMPRPPQQAPGASERPVIMPAVIPPPVPAPAVPGTFQVARVQLDFDGNDDDFESDYSDESSDDAE